jgi:hemolysin activation/secretion protein
VDFREPQKQNKLNIAWRVSAALGVSAALVVVSVSPARAQQAAAVPAAPAFEIKRFDLSGNTLLSSERIQSIVMPYLGAQRTLADVQRAQAAIEEAYRDIGYGAVQVSLPEQNITSGVIQFRIIQPRVGKVILDGNRHFNSDNVRASLPTIREGQIPNSSAIARNLQQTGEHPVKKTTVLLRTSDNPEVVDVNVKVDDDRPWRVVLSLDNTGNSDTGYLRAGVGFQHTNLLTVITRYRCSTSRRPPTPARSTFTASAITRRCTPGTVRWIFTPATRM